VLLLKKGFTGKISLFSVIILAFVLILIFVLPTFAVPTYVAGNYSVNFTNGSAYSTSNVFKFEVNWTNTTNETFVNDVNTNFTLGLPDGTITSYSLSTSPVLVNNTTGTFPLKLNITFTQSQLGPAGIYNFSFGLKTQNGTNASQTWTNVTPVVVLNITNASNPIHLYFNNTPDANKTYTYPQAVNATVTSSGGTVYLYRNGVLVVNGTSPQSENILLGNGTGTYAYTFNATGDQNHTGNTSALTFYALVNKGTTNAVTYIDDALINKTVTYPTSVTIKGNSTSTTTSPTLTLYAGDLSLGSGTSVNQTITAGAGTYNIVYNASENENWTSVTNNTIFLIVSPNSSNPVGLTINNGTAYNNQNVTISYGTTITVNCSNSYSSSGSCSLYRNETLVTNNTNETVILGNETWAYKVNTSGNTNYSANASGETFYVMVNKGTPDVKIFINDNPANTTINYSSALTIKGNSSSGGVLPLFNISITNVTTSSQSVSISNTSQSSPIFLLPSIGNGTYRINLTANGNSNWSSTSNDTIFLLVNKGTLNLSLSVPNVIYPSNTTATSTEINTGDSDVNYTLYLNASGFGLVNYSSALGNGNISNTNLLGAASYRYILNTTAGTFANWTANTTGIDANVTVSKGATNLSLIITQITSANVPTSTSASGSGCPTQGAVDVNCTLWRNSILINSSNATDVSETVALNTGTWVYNYSTDGGNNWSSNSTATTLTSGAVSPAPSGGGGYSPSTTSATKVTLTRGNANITVPSIAASKMANVSITKTEDVDFRQVNISVANSVNNIKIVITKLAGSPASVTHIIEGKVYHYIQIDKTNFTDTDLSKVYIKFAVNKTWLTDSGVDKTNISLYRWLNDKWNELTTSYLSEDTSEVLYQAESPGFSYFLIGTKLGEVTQAPTAPTGAAITCTENWSCTNWSICTNSVQTRTCTDSNACGTTVNKPVESQDCIEAQFQADNTWMYYSIAAVIIIAIVAILFIFRKKVITKPSKKK
jgi:PGF-pre-PGF domain-containing protein